MTFMGFSIRPSSCAHALCSGTFRKIPGFVTASLTRLNESQVMFHCGPHPVFIGSEEVQTKVHALFDRRRKNPHAMCFNPPRRVDWETQIRPVNCDIYNVV
jgi:hypothetical protein